MDTIVEAAIAEAEANEELYENAAEESGAKPTTDGGDRKDGFVTVEFEDAGFDDEQPRSASKERVIEAASDMRAAFDDLVDVVVVGDAPAAFVQPGDDVLLSGIKVERVAEHHDLTMTRFDNREICLEP